MRRSLRVWARASLLSLVSLSALPRGASAATAEAKDKNGDRLSVATTADAVFAAVCPKEQKAKETCSAESGLRINPPQSAKAELSRARVRVVTTEGGRGIVEVLLGAPGARNYLMLIAPSGEGPRVVFAGWTGPGEGRTYRAEAAGRGERIVLETSARHCGASVALARETLNDKTLTLDSVASLARDPRPVVDLTAKASAPTGKLPLLSSDGASSGNARLVADGNAETAWEESVKGAGVGQLLLLSAPRDVEVLGLDFAFRGPRGPEDRVPESILVHTERDVFRVTFPAEARDGGGFGVVFPQGRSARCFTLEIERSASGAGKVDPKAEPTLRIAEVAARTRFDGETADTLAAGLGGDPGATNERLRLLVGLGEPGLAAIARAYPNLDAATRDAVRRVVDALDCDAKLAVFVPLLASSDREEEGRARDRVRRCGKEAFDVLAQSFAGARGEARARFAEEASLLDPERAVPLLVGALVSADNVAERRLLRKALAKASNRDASAPAFEALFAAESFDKLPLKSKVEVFRASIARLTQTRSARAALERTLVEAGGFRERYLLLPAIAEVAKADDPAAVRALESLIADRNPHLRARAVEVARGVAPARGLVLARSRDPEPRVREAAMRSVDGAQLSVTDLRALTGTLRPEPWTFVKRAGVSVAAAGPRDATVDDTLGELIEWTDAPEVRAEALVALGARRGTTQLARIVSRAKDEREILYVRLRAVEALGNLCVDEVLEPLGELVEKGAGSSFEPDLKVAALAVHALTEIAPPDLAERLAPLTAPDAPADLANLARKALADRRAKKGAVGRCR